MLCPKIKWSHVMTNDDVDVITMMVKCQFLCYVIIYKWEGCKKLWANFSSSFTHICVIYSYTSLLNILHILHILIYMSYTHILQYYIYLIYSYICHILIYFITSYTSYTHICHCHVLIYSYISYADNMSYIFLFISDHMIDSIAWVTDLNLLALKTRHGWRQVNSPQSWWW